MEVNEKQADQLEDDGPIGFDEPLDESNEFEDEPNEEEEASGEGEVIMRDTKKVSSIKRNNKEISQLSLRNNILKRQAPSATLVGNLKNSDNKT